MSIGALVAWRVYVRFRRALGRQRLSKYRAPVTLVIFPALVVLVAVPSWRHPVNLALFAVALCCGAGLGVFGLSRTRFEAIAGKGLFYTPNAHLGVALALLFVARLAYRFFEIFVLSPSAQRSSAEFAQSPLTLSVFGLLAGYYITYAMGLARWRAKVLRAKRRREEALSATSNAAPPAIPQFSSEPSPPSPEAGSEPRGTSEARS